MDGHESNDLVSSVKIFQHNCSTNKSEKSSQQRSEKFEVTNQHSNPGAHASSSSSSSAPSSPAQTIDSQKSITLSPPRNNRTNLFEPLTEKKDEKNYAKDLHKIQLESRDGLRDPPPNFSGSKSVENQPGSSTQQSSNAQTINTTTQSSQHLLSQSILLEKDSPRNPIPPSSPAEGKKNPFDSSQPDIVERSPGGRYVRFSEKLGRGAYKDVYRAYDTNEGIEVAWNVVKLSGMPKADRARIINEVRLLERLHHRNIISFHGSWVNREHEIVNFVTEILSSGTLKQFINKVQVVRWKIAKRWAIQILQGLEYLHSQEPPIIHRDLKCDNIFINGARGDLRIGDFGLSTSINDRAKGLSVLGTPEFMAPELYDEDYDEKVDIYAFGMCLLEILIKEAPYSECINAAQIYKKVTKGVPPASLRRIKSQEARDFIMLCIGRKAENETILRPSAKDLLQHPFLISKGADDEAEIEVDPPLQDVIITELPSSIEDGSRSCAFSRAGITGESKFSSSYPGTSYSSSDAEVDSLAKASSSLNYQSSFENYNQVESIEHIPSSSTLNHKVSENDSHHNDLKNRNISKTLTKEKVNNHHEAHNTPSKMDSNVSSSDSSRRLRKYSSADSQSEPNSPLKHQASVVEESNTLENNYDDDLMKLSITLPSNGHTQSVHFDFHLIKDSPLDAAKKLVNELDIPETASAEICETIGWLAHAARLKQQSNEEKSIEKESSTSNVNLNDKNSERNNGEHHSKTDGEVVQTNKDYSLTSSSTVVKAISSSDNHYSSKESKDTDASRIFKSTTVGNSNEVPLFQSNGKPPPHPNKKINPKPSLSRQRSSPEPHQQPSTNVQSVRKGSDDAGKSSVSNSLMKESKNSLENLNAESERERSHSFSGATNNTDQRPPQSNSPQTQTSSIFPVQHRGNSAEITQFHISQPFTESQRIKSSTNNSSATTVNSSSLARSDSILKCDDIIERSPGGRYVRLAEKLGSGAYKDVYRAYDTIEGIEVSWHVVKLSSLSKNDRSRIINEIRLLEHLDHPNIIQFHGSWVNREKEVVNFATEMKSGSLKSFINKVQVIRWKIAKRWAVQILKALDYFHSQDPRIIHRDLKCENIFINGTSSELCIGDFGLSTRIRGDTKNLSILGTPEFMAPELYDEIYDEKVDIYSFGMCLLEIFTKEAPYSECSNAAQIYKKVTKGIPPDSLRRIGSKEARDFITLCIGSKSRPSAKELLHHPFLTPKANDDAEVKIEPTVLSLPIDELPMAKERVISPSTTISRSVSAEKGKSSSLVNCFIPDVQGEPSASNKKDHNANPSEQTIRRNSREMFKLKNAVSEKLSMQKDVGGQLRESDLNTRQPVITSSAILKASTDEGPRIKRVASFDTKKNVESKVESSNSTNVSSSINLPIRSNSNVVPNDSKLQSTKESSFFNIETTTKPSNEQSDVDVTNSKASQAPPVDSISVKSSSWHAAAKKSFLDFMSRTSAFRASLTENHEGSFSDSDSVDSAKEELRRLERKYLKSMNKAQEIFDERKDDLQRSMVEKEAEHLLILEKLEKDMAEYEFRLKLEETEKQKRLKQIEHEWQHQKEKVEEAKRRKSRKKSH